MTWGECVKKISDMDFIEIIEPIAENDMVLEMKKYKQHYNTSCYEHCYLAAYYCYKICKRFNLDYRSAARGAMLHDLFLYDWHIYDGTRKRFHAFRHGKIAYENASKAIELNMIEKDMIINHMWPVTIKIPKTREGFILTIVDKYCAVYEGIIYLKNRFGKKIIKL